MSRCIRDHGRKAFGDERGASLIIALILLLMMTLLSLAVLRTTTLEERMSANLLDRTFQFQAAESALREAEALIYAGTVTHSSVTSGCSNGICAAPAAGTADRWLSESDWTTASGIGNNDSAIKTQYIIEYMGSGTYGPSCDSDDFTQLSTDVSCSMYRYRVTARSQGEGRAAVLLQSNYLSAQ